jgi:hypothetical protein
MRRISVYACLFLLFFSRAGIVLAGPAFDELVEAAGGEDMSVVFDGAERYSPGERTGSGRSAESPSSGLAAQEFHVSSARVPVPMPVMEKISGELHLSDNVKSIVAQAKNHLASTTAGKTLAYFMGKENVEVKWAPLSSLTRAPAYARVCRPEECPGKKIIYLNNRPGYKELFLDKNRTFLAVVLAHELTHLMDFRNIGGGIKDNEVAANFFLELNGWSNETYVYHELLAKGVAPKPGSDNAAIQRIRLDLAIRDYVNKGDRPSSKDFPLLSRIDDLSFDEYVTAVTKNPRIGSMSLGGVVRRMYGNLAPSFEDPPKPPAYNYAATKEYEKYLKLRDALGHRTKVYIDWKKANVDAPSSFPPGLPDENYGGGGQYDPGGGDYDLPSLPSPDVDFDGGGFSPFSF